MSKVIKLKGYGKKTLSNTQRIIDARERNNPGLRGLKQPKKKK